MTGLVNEGSNAIGVSVTGGWYTENFGFRDGARPVYGPQPSFAGQLLLEYADGSSEWIVTGSDWRISDRSPVVRAGIYLGEDYDARRIQDGWDRPGFDASGWADAAVMDAGPVPGPRTGPVVPWASARSGCTGTQFVFFFLFLGQLALALFVAVVGCCQGVLSAVESHCSSFRPPPARFALPNAQRCGRHASSHAPEAAPPPAGPHPRPTGKAPPSA